MQTVEVRKATARVPTQPRIHSRLYYERLSLTVVVVIVEAGAERMMGGDPCGRLPFG